MHSKHLKISLLLITAIILTLGISISFQSLLAAWTAPLLSPTACDTGNPGCDEPLNKGSFSQSKGGPLIINADNIAFTGLVAYGNVGIGVASLDSYLPNDLVIYDDKYYGVRSGLTILSSTTGLGDIAFADGPSGADRYMGKIWYKHSDDSLNFNASSTLIMTMIGGNVGIGTAVPAAKLHVSGDALINGIRVGIGNGSITSNTAIGAGVLNSTTGGYNTGVGQLALNSNTTGDNNSALGNGALRYNNGYRNTAVGSSALYNNTTGSDNVANGYQALFNNNGHGNVANGRDALYSNTSGGYNTAIGYQALYTNTTGTYNIAIGTGSLYSFNGGILNVAIGHNALYNNQATGGQNLAIGYNSLYANTTGVYNNAVGKSTLSANTTGNFNSAFGDATVTNNTIGSNNSGFGGGALLSNTTGNYNSGFGGYALRFITTGSNNTALGYNAGVASGNGAFTNATAIGANATVAASNRVRIGDTSVTRISGQVSFSSDSDLRLKNNIQPSSLGLDFILKLKPSTFNFIHDGQKGIKYTGLIAQEVEQSLKELGTDFSGLLKPENKNDFYELRYTDFVTPLIKAVQEQQKQIEDLKIQIEELKNNK